MDTLPHRGAYSPSTKLVSFSVLPEEMRKCRIQLYDTNGRVKCVPDYNPCPFRPLTSDSQYWPPVNTAVKHDKKTKFLMKVARGLQAGLQHIHPRQELTKSELCTEASTEQTTAQTAEQSTEFGSSSAQDVLQKKSFVIERRRTIHGVTPVEDKTGMIEIDIPSQGCVSTSSQISQLTDLSEQTGHANISRLISITTSQPYIRNKHAVLEGSTEITSSDRMDSVDDLEVKRSVDELPSLEEDIPEENAGPSVDTCAEEPPRLTLTQMATRYRTRKLEYGKSYQNLLQQNVRKMSRDKKDSVLYKKQRTLRKVRSFGDFNEKNEFRTFRPLYKFRRAVRTVIVMMKAGTSNSKSQLSERQTLSWTQVHDEAGTSRRAYERFGLTFDPSIFRANREAQLSTEAKAILSMDTTDRTEEQLHLTLANLKQAVEAFGEFPLKMQKSLVRVGWYEHFERKRVIIRQGHVAENFYFILSGTAVVTVLETNKQSGEQYGYTVALLKKGNSFGELALMHGARRSATVTCKNDVELLAVGRQDFIDIFMNVETNREPDHIRYLRSIDTLQGWPFEVLPYNDPKICIYTYFRRGVLLCKESNETDWLYILVTGSCRVLKSLYATRPNFEKSNSADRFRMNGFNRFSSISLPVSARETPEDYAPRSVLNSHKGRREKKTGRKRQVATCLPVIRNRSQAELQQSAEEHIRHLDEILGERDDMIDLFDEIPQKKRQNNNEDRRKVFVQIQKLGPKEIYGLEQAVFSTMGKTTSTSLVSDGAECVLINRKFFLEYLTEDTAKRIRKMGLEQAVFSTMGKTTSTSLVSDGAECVLINRKFFLEYLTEDTAKRIRKMIQPIPSDESLQQKLQNKANWEAYKSLTVSDHLVYRKHLQDFLNL